MHIKNWSSDDKVLIIAEIGNNHEGDFDVAVDMIQVAAKTGVDAVKFQTFKTDHYVHNSQIERVKRLKSFELAYCEFAKLSEIAHELGLLFISTPFDLESAKFLGTICDAIKISSSDNVFYPLLKNVHATGKPVFASTGLATFEELQKLTTYFDLENIALLHCVTSYPVPDGQVNVSYIRKIAEKLKCTAGYSDHSLGIDAAALAVASGARIIEKHFTLDNNYSKFMDHKISSDPSEMNQLVKRIREVETKLGSANDIQPVEEDILQSARRSIVAAKPLRIGHILSEKDITWVRPGGGIPPGEEYRILGKTLKQDLEIHTTLSADHVE